MADEAFEADAPTTPGEEGKRGKLVPIIIIGVVMLLEGIGVYSLTKFLNPAPPEAVAGEGAEADEGTALLADQFKELEVASARPTNKLGTRVVTVGIRVSILVKSEDFERAQKLTEAMKDRLHDRVNIVVRGASQRDLNEPGLETLRRQLKTEFNQMFKDETLVVEVLIPELLQTQ